MSDHGPAPDPMDKAYAQAEAMLDDEAAGAARRARVLGAVAREAQASTSAVSTPPGRRLAWGRGGWLAAASVAGVTALVAIQLYRPAVTRPEPPAAEASVEAAAAPAIAPAREPAAAARAPAPPRAPTSPFVASRAEMRSRRDDPVVVASPPPPPSFQTAPAAAPPPSPVTPPASADAVTARRAASPLAAARAPSAAMEASVPASPAVSAARLRAAAAAGRIAELTALLTPGAPVDAPDDDGETALMMTVQANHPAAAALLRRHGANLDLKNRAGVSARDMAASIGDPDLDRALGLAP